MFWTNRWFIVDPNMLNFLPRTRNDLPRSLLRTWVLASATLPVLMPALFALMIAGDAALSGNSFAGALADFVAVIDGDWLRMFAQLWIVAYFLAAGLFGVGRQLIGLTVRRPLSAPLADMDALQQQLSRFFRGIVASRGLIPAALPVGLFPPDFSRDFTGLRPPPSLLTGATPLLE